MNKAFERARKGYEFAMANRYQDEIEKLGRQLTFRDFVSVLYLR